MPRGSFAAIPSAGPAPYTRLYWENPFPGHRERYLRVLRDYDALRGSLPNDEWRALLLVLTAWRQLWERSAPQLDYRRGEVDGQAILRHTHSHAEELLLKLALHLYGYPTGLMGPVDLATLLSIADDYTWRLALAAVERRRGAGSRIEMGLLA